MNPTYPRFVDDLEPIAGWRDATTYNHPLPDLAKIINQSIKILSLKRNNPGLGHPAFLFGQASDPVIDFITKLTEHHVECNDLQTALNRVGYHMIDTTTCQHNEI